MLLHARHKFDLVTLMGLVVKNLLTLKLVSCLKREEQTKVDSLMHEGRFHYAVHCHRFSNSRLHVFH